MKQAKLSRLCKSVQLREYRETYSYERFHNILIFLPPSCLDFP